MTRGWAMRNASTVGPARTRQRSGRVGDDVRDGRLAEQDRDLPEEVAARQAGALGPVDDDRRLAIEDDEEARSR